VGRRVGGRGMSRKKACGAGREGRVGREGREGRERRVVDARL